MKKYLLPLISLIIIFSLCMPVAGVAEASKGERLYQKLYDIAKLIKENSYYSNQNDDPIKKMLTSIFNKNPEQFDIFANEMLGSYDDYSKYLTKDDYELLYNSDIQYAGIGVTLGYENDCIQIKEIKENSPAKKAGLGVGDRLVAANGIDITSYSNKALGSILRGENGTELTLSVIKTGKKTPQKVTLKRDIISYGTIKEEYIEKGIYYIKITGFNGLESLLGFINAVDTAVEVQTKSLIIDVRNNRGGDAFALLNMINYLIPEKGVTFFASSGKKNTEFEKVQSTGNPKNVFNGIFILTNEHSASSAEIFAGSLQDLGLARNVGTKTYGKGKGQQHIALGENGDEGILILTETEAFLPSTGYYDKRGIEPYYNIQNKLVPIKLEKISFTKKPYDMYTGHVSENVKKIEAMLNALGYFSDPSNNSLNKRTMFAIDDFRKEQKLKEYKYIDIKTQKAILNEYNRLLTQKEYEDTQKSIAIEKAREALKTPINQPIQPETPVD